MDGLFGEQDTSINGIGSDIENLLASPGPEQQSWNFDNGANYDNLDINVFDIPFLPSSPSPDNFAPSSTVSFRTPSPDEQDADPVFKFLNQILVEESLEEKHSMFHDPLALRATEKSLYEAIGQQYPPPSYHPADFGNHKYDSPDSIVGSCSEYTNSSNAGSNHVEPGEYNSSMEQSHLQESSSNSVLGVGSQSSFRNVNGSNDRFQNYMNPLENTNMLHNIFSDAESILQFKRGMEEASKFLPISKPLVIDLDKYALPQKSDDVTSAASVKAENSGSNQYPIGMKGRKHHHMDDDDSEDTGRGSKQSAIYIDEAELSEMFDKVLLCSNDKDDLVNGSFSGRTHPKKIESKGEAVDLRTLLINCAQSVAADNYSTAHEQLKQLRQLSSPTGDVYQRLANVFICGLEARLGGTGMQLYESLARRKTTAAEKIKTYQVYLSACPFQKMSIFFANKMIVLMASEASTLHIVDFGILYGLQWSVLIQQLAELPGGPPKLRITGIELPQPGFRPAEGVDETGDRLKKHCERFGVPFEYQAIATQNWETIKIEELKIAPGEFLAVNCLLRFDRLLDETVIIDSPRDAVLNLIRKMKPNIFVNAVTNGLYSAPFYVTRFREALYHYSTLFDMFDATLPPDDPQRLNFEQDFYGREVINVIACEGAERVERPETYKQSQIRHIRAGFKQLPLNVEIMEKLRTKVTDGYHKDFLFARDGNWMLQGWKGRIICASSCWVPA